MAVFRAFLAVFVLSATCLLAGGCANPRATFTSAFSADPAKPYLGRSRSEIVACAGTPSASLKRSDADVLIYRYSGAGPVPREAKKKAEKKGLFGGGGRSSDKKWECTASLTFENDRLVRVSYAHKDVDSPYAWQSQSDPEKAEQMRKAEPPACTFSLPNCH